MRPTKAIVTVLTVVSTVTLLCYQKGFAYTLEESFQKTIPRQEAALLEVNNVNGSIQVSPWAADSIKIEALKRVTAPDREKAEECLGELEIQVMRRGKEISVETVYPGGDCPSGCLFGLLRGKKVRWNVDYTISVPVSFDLELHTTNGSVKAQGTKGEVEAWSTNGTIRITEVEGSVLGQTTNGSVKIGDIRGDAVARSTNGSVKLWGIAGSVRCSTTNGNVRAEITRTKLEKSCNLSTTNGSISVSLPAEISADIDARTTNGKMRFGLPVTVQGELSKRRLRGKIGQGGPLLRLRTTNGNITIEKRKASKGKAEAALTPEEKRDSTGIWEHWEAESPFSEESCLFTLGKEGWQWDDVSRFNRVEGLALGLKLTVRPEANARNRVYAKGDYSLARKRWTYRLGMEKSLGKRLSLGADVHDIVGTQDGWIVSDREATWLMLLAGTAARDYFRQQGYEVYLRQQLSNVGRLRVVYSRDCYESLPKRTDWSLFNWTGEKRSNPPIDEGWINSVRIFYHRELPADGHIEVQGEIADRRLGGDFQFRRSEVELVGHRRLGPEQSLHTRVKVGLADKELPLQRKFQLGGIGTLRGYGYKEFQGDAMLLVQAEYRFSRGGKALVPFVDAGCTWPHDRKLKLQTLRFDGGIGLIWKKLRLNLAVAPPRGPRWLLRFHKTF